SHGGINSIPTRRSSDLSGWPGGGEESQRKLLHIMSNRSALLRRLRHPCGGSRELVSSTCRPAAAWQSWPTAYWMCLRKSCQSLRSEEHTSELQSLAYLV